MRMRLAWFLRFTMPLVLAMTTLLFVSPRLALAQPDRTQTEPPIPADAAVLELDLPPGAEVSIDGVPQGDRRRIEFRPFPPGVTGRYKVKATLPGGHDLARTALLERGWRVRLPLRDIGERPELVVQTGHSTCIQSVAFSRDGRRALTGSWDKTAILWDVESGRMLRRFLGHTYPVWAVDISPDGRHVLTGSKDTTAIIWDAETGQAVRVLRGHKGWVVSARFSPDGGRVLTGSGDKTAVLWDSETGRKLLELRGHTEGVHSVAFSPDGRRIMTGSDDTTAVIWDAETSQRQRELPGHADSVMSVAFSPDGRRVLTGHGDGTAIIWDAETGRRLLELRGHARPISAAFSPDGRRVLTGSWDQTAIIWDAETGQERLKLRGHSNAIHSVAFSPDGHRALTGSWDNTAIVWDTATGNRFRTFRGGDSVLNVAVSPDGRRALTGYHDKTAIVWDIESGRKLSQMLGHGGEVPGVAFSPDGLRVLTSSDDHTAALWEAETGLRIREFRGHTDTVWAVAFSPDGRRVLTGSADKTAILWDAATGQAIWVLRGEAGEVHSVAFSRDGRRILISPNDGTAVLWDAETGGQLRVLRGHADSVMSVAFSSDGRRLLTGSVDMTAIIWDAETGQPLRVLRGHTGLVHSVAFSPNGRHALTGSTDKTAILWDVESGQALQTLRGHADYILSVAYSPDGRRAVTASYDGMTQLWDLATGDELVRLISVDQGKDWLVVTPEGLFDGTEGGRQAVSFRVGSRLNVVPVDRFFQDFYRPGLLTDLGRGLRPMPEATFGRSKPPELRIASPAPGTSEAVDVTIEVEAVDQGGGVSALTLFHNGAKILSRDTSIEGKTTRRRFAVALIQGQNSMRATAASGDGSWESEPVEVVLTYEKPLPRSEIYLVAVGINRYADAGLNLNFAAKDADAFAELFRRRGGRLYERVHVTELTDAQATRSGVSEALKAVAKQTRPQDTLVLFLAGHGVMIGQRYYFLPHDLRRQADHLDEDVRSQGLPVDTLTDSLGSAKALKRALILDTCASGGALGVVLKGRSGVSFRKAIERQARTQGIFTIAAASATAEAQESAKLGHGVLSYVLLAGLKAVEGGPLEGQSVQPGAEGVVDVLEWFNYAAGRVPRLMESLYGSAQDVQVGAQGASFPVLPIEDR